MISIRNISFDSEDVLFASKMNLGLRTDEWMKNSYKKV